MKCPNCGEDFWVSGPRGEDICHECGLTKEESKSLAECSNE